MATNRAVWSVHLELFLEILAINLVLGFPHRSTAEDIYEGYRIPNGSIVIFNSWYEQRSCCDYVSRC